MNARRTLARSLAARYGASGSAAQRCHRAAAAATSPMRERLQFVAHQLELSNTDAQRISDAQLEQACAYLLSIYPEPRGSRVYLLILTVGRFLARCAALILALFSFEGTGVFAFLLYVGLLTLRPVSYKFLSPLTVVALSVGIFLGFYGAGLLEPTLALPVALVLLYYSLEP